MAKKNIKEEEVNHQFIGSQEELEFVGMENEIEVVEAEEQIATATNV